jgi:hypothetical protein
MSCRAIPAAADSIVIPLAVVDREDFLPGQSSIVDTYFIQHSVERIANRELRSSGIKISEGRV